MARHPRSEERQGLDHLYLRFLNVAADQAAEKGGLVVIPSEARDLLFRKYKKKADSSGKPRPRNDNFVVFPQPLKPQPTRILKEGHR
jgi:hypothetical protein